MRVLLVLLIIVCNTFSTQSIAQSLKCLDTLEDKICLMDEIEVCERHVNTRYATALRAELEKLPPLFSALACELKTIEIGYREGLVGKHFSHSSKIYLADQLFERGAEFKVVHQSNNAHVLNYPDIYNYVVFDHKIIPNGLTLTLAHELAHFFEAEFLIAPAFHCLPPTVVPKALNHARRCAKGCDRLFTSEEVQEQYRLLKKSDHLTFYSLHSPREDFAELTSARPLLRLMKIKTRVDDQLVYDFNQELASPRLSHKIKTIERLLKFPIDDPDAAGEEAWAHLTCDTNYQFEESPAKP